MRKRDGTSSTVQTHEPASSNTLEEVETLMHDPQAGLTIEQRLAEFSKLTPLEKIDLADEIMESARNELRVLYRILQPPRKSRIRVVAFTSPHKAQISSGSAGVRSKDSN